jgi:ribosome-associated translation inhibitor RaiA
MQTPLQLTFRSMEHSEALAVHLRKRAARLDELFDGVISCHVVIERAGHHHQHGDRYRFSINVSLPGHELNVTHDPPEDRAERTTLAAADRAFDEAERQLEHWVTRQRSERHQARPTGI